MANDVNVTWRSDGERIVTEQGFEEVAKIAVEQGTLGDVLAGQAAVNAINTVYNPIGENPEWRELTRLGAISRIGYILGQREERARRKMGGAL